MTLKGSKITYMKYILTLLTSLFLCTAFCQSFSGFAEDRIGAIIYESGLYTVTNAEDIIFTFESQLPGEYFNCLCSESTLVASGNTTLVVIEGLVETNWFPLDTLDLSVDGIHCTQSNMGGKEIRLRVTDDSGTGTNFQLHGMFKRAISSFIVTDDIEGI